MTNYHIGVASQPSPQGTTLTIESIGALVGIFVSAIALVTVLVKLTSRFNELSSSVKQLAEDLEKHSSAEGHEKLIQKVEHLEKTIQSLDKKVDLQVQDYVHGRDVQTMLLNQLNQKIDHKSTRFEGEIKDLQKFLQSQSNFRIRNYHQGEEK